MSIMYPANKTKKTYNNSINRKRQNQQQILNSLKSWNVKIAPSGLDKPDPVLSRGMPTSIKQVNTFHLSNSVTKAKPEPNGATHASKLSCNIATIINQQDHRIQEAPTNTSLLRKNTQDVKHNKSKQKELTEKKSTNSIHVEQCEDERKDLANYTRSVADHSCSEINHRCQAEVDHNMVEIPLKCSLDQAMVAEDSDFINVENQNTSLLSVPSASRSNCQQNTNSKARVTGWGWNQRQSHSLITKERVGNRLTSDAVHVLDTKPNCMNEYSGPRNGKLKDSNNRVEHSMPKTSTFPPRETLAIQPSQLLRQHHLSNGNLHEQRQHLDHNSSDPQGSKEAMQHYTFDFLREVGPKFPIAGGTVGSSSANSVFRAASQMNYNFTPQFQQQMMQHYHNSQMIHQQSQSSERATSMQLHYAVTQQHQQPNQTYIHNSPRSYAGEEIPHLVSSLGGAGAGSSGVLNDLKPYQCYTGLASAEMQMNSQNIDHSSYAYNRNGSVQQHQQGVNHQHPIYLNIHQQHQVHVNGYQQNNYQYNNRNVSALRSNQYVLHGGGASAHREESGRTVKKSSWSSSGAKGKNGAVVSNSAKHFKGQSNGYSYRKSHQHFHNSLGGGHDQYYDHVAIQHQQTLAISQQHHKQHLHRNLVYVRGNDRGKSSSLTQEYVGAVDGASVVASDHSSPIHSAPSSPKSKGSLDISIPNKAQYHELCILVDPNGETNACGAEEVIATECQEKSLPDDEEFELKALCAVPRSSSSSSMVSIPSTESSAISSIISQTHLLECTNASINEYDSDSSHSSDFRDGNYSKFDQMSCDKVYRSSSSTSGISSSATNPLSNEFIPSVPSSLRGSSAGLSEIIVRSHSYHGSHQNLTVYGGVRSAGECSSPIGSPTGTLRSSFGTQSAPIFGDLFATSNHNYMRHSTQFAGNHSSPISYGSTSSLEMALRNSSSSLPASAVPPTDCQSMQSGYPRKRSQSGRTSPSISQEPFRCVTASYTGQTKGQGSYGNISGRKNNQISMSYVHRSSLPSDFQYTPADRFILRANDIELKIPSGQLSNDTVWDRLSEAIWGKFCGAQQTAEKYLQKMQLWRDLYICIKQGFPKYGLYLVGSTISGFGADNSDVDMCLVSRSGPGYFDSRNEALQNLMLVKNYFMSVTASTFDKFCLIQAKVPILRFQDSKNGIEVDLNYNNCVGIRNTHLLHCYSQMDWRVRPLVLVVKLWAQHHNINDAKSMTISSYSLVLMVIHFLQYGVKPSVLPCLHSLYPEKFMKIIDINAIEMIERVEPYTSDNRQTLGELLLHFLEYYKDFDYAHYAISVRLASIIPIEECRLAKSYKNDPHQWKHLCIEEPFDLTNTARSVFDGEVFEQIKNTIYTSWRMLKDANDLSVLFGDPLFTPVTSTLSITS